MNEEIFNALQAEMAEPTKLEVITKECQLNMSAQHLRECAASTGGHSHR